MVGSTSPGHPSLLLQELRKIGFFKAVERMPWRSSQMKPDSSKIVILRKSSTSPSQNQKLVASSKRSSVGPVGDFPLSIKISFTCLAYTKASFSEEKIRSNEGMMHEDA